MRSRKIRILFVYTNLFSFVQRDLEILEKYFDIKTIKVETFLVPRKGRNPAVFLRLLHKTVWADVVFCWFASINTFFFSLIFYFLRKKSLVVVGGYDAAFMPKISYGVFTQRWSRMQAMFVYEHVNKILVVDASLKKDILRNSNFSLKKQ